MMTLKRLFSKKIIVLLTFLIGWTVSSQNVLISQGGTVNVSGGEKGKSKTSCFTFPLLPKNEFVKLNKINNIVQNNSIK
jgi:hypothetical protein